jgi:hypothetical protein
MSQQETAAPSVPKKKQVRKEIGEKLAGVLAEYKKELGEKKLETHVRNISKQISRDLLKFSKKQKRHAKKASARLNGKTRKVAEKK